MAEAVRLEMRRAGWGSNSSGLRVRERARRTGSAWVLAAKRTARGCCGSTDRGRSKFGVRRRLVPEELDAREWLCWVR
jgi:hypothetical protein